MEYSFDQNKPKRIISAFFKKRNSINNSYWESFNFVSGSQSQFTFKLQVNTQLYVLFFVQVFEYDVWMKSNLWHLFMFDSKNHNFIIEYNVKNSRKIL